MIALDFRLDDQATAKLRQLAAAAEDLTPAMQEIAGYLLGRIAERFRTETDPLGVPWKPAQRVSGYVDASGRRVPGDGGQTLTLRGDLRRSMREDYGRDFAAAGPEASGGAAVYAGVHQDGARIAPRNAGALRTPFGPRGAVTIPARPYLGFDPAVDGPEVLDVIERHLAAVLGSGAAGAVP